MPYMSPEQVEGRVLDARSDLFSLGVMFYEMLGGSRPFAGPSSPALMSAILRDHAPLLTDRRAEVPEALARLVARCLEKHPEERVQTARDVYNELRHVQKQLESGFRRTASSGTVAGDAEASLWIAVLPFGARSSDAETEALAAGLTEDITSGLSRFPALSVIAPQSAAAFRNSPLDVRQIAERLGARYVLGGTARKSAGAVRVAAHLVDARSGAHLWTDTYDQPLERTDLFTIQDDITDRIVATVADKAGVLARSMVQALRQLPMEQLSAREPIFRCWMFQWHPLPGLHAEVRRALEHHLDAHPGNPHLWAELANFYVCEYSLFFNPLPDALGRALRAARRAIEIDPGNQEGWEMVALTSFYMKDEAGMLEASDRAIRSNPRNSNALAWMGNIRTHGGDYDRGCELTGRAMTLNPAHPGWYHFAPFNRLFARGEYAEALKAARRVNMPDFVWMLPEGRFACRGGRVGRPRARFARRGRRAGRPVPARRFAPPARHVGTREHTAVRPRNRGSPLGRHGRSRPRRRPVRRPGRHRRHGGRDRGRCGWRAGAIDGRGDSRSSAGWTRARRPGAAVSALHRPVLRRRSCGALWRLRSDAGPRARRGESVGVPWDVGGGRDVLRAEPAAAAPGTAP
jgi:TolB-like protein